MTGFNVSTSAYSDPQQTEMFLQDFPDVSDVRHNSKATWTYLIASHVRFHRNVPHAIRLNKPEDNALFTWLEKLATAGQCGLIFVENINVEHPDYARIKDLFDAKGITLVNLEIDQRLPSNIVKGPWH